MHVPVCGLHQGQAWCAWRPAGGKEVTEQVTHQPTGVELIARERERQIVEEGYGFDHDDCHSSGSLVDAARAYCWAAGSKYRGVPLSWPWAAEEWKPSDNPIRNLVRAGALIAAEIDRLQRADTPDEEGQHG